MPVTSTTTLRSEGPAPSIAAHSPELSPTDVFRAAAGGHDYPARTRSAVRLHQVLGRRPVLPILQAAHETQRSNSAAASETQVLEENVIAREITNRVRGRLPSWGEHLEVLGEGIEASPAESPS